MGPSCKLDVRSTLFRIESAGVIPMFLRGSEQLNQPYQRVFGTQSVWLFNSYPSLYIALSSTTMTAQKPAFPPRLIVWRLAPDGAHGAEVFRKESVRDPSIPFIAPAFQGQVWGGGVHGEGEKRREEGWS